jgi:pyridoxamine-phosphate oxidase
VIVGLREQDTSPDPISQFHRWFSEAEAAGVLDRDAMVVATADRDGDPSARVVLLRGVDERGFRFYTNFDSAKGRDLADRPRAALVLYWREQGRQVRVRGTVTRLDDAESLDYWTHRPRASQLSAWASQQSEPIADRDSLEASIGTAAAARERLESFAYRTEPAQLNRIRVRVPDRPGVLARITQILGAAQINLEDFELRHVSPEYGGVLVILVAGADNAARARELLRREGFAAA